MTAAARSRADARRARTGLDVAAFDQISAAFNADAPLRLTPKYTPSEPRWPLRIAVKLRVSESRSSDAVAAWRSGGAIRCLLGANGSGKTLMGVHYLMPSIDEGRTIYSTVPILDAATGLPHSQYVPFRRWQQLFDARNSDFFADEISAIAASRDHNNLHSDVINRVQQLRKDDNTFTWTAPSWKRADTALREVTQTVTECFGSYPDRQAAKTAQVLWAPNRLFKAVTYNTRDFDEWSAGRRKDVTPDLKEWFYGPGSREFGSYDTYASVDRIEGYEPNSCVDCGLPTRKTYCKGHS